MFINGLQPELQVEVKRKQLCTVDGVLKFCRHWLATYNDSFASCQEVGSKSRNAADMQLCYAGDFDGSLYGGYDDTALSYLAHLFGADDCDSDVSYDDLQQPHCADDYGCSCADDMMQSYWTDTCHEDNILCRSALIEEAETDIFTSDDRVILSSHVDSALGQTAADIFMSPSENCDPRIQELTARLHRLECMAEEQLLIAEDQNQQLRRAWLQTQVPVPEPLSFSMEGADMPDRYAVSSTPQVNAGRATQLPNIDVCESYQQLYNVEEMYVMPHASPDQKWQNHRDHLVDTGATQQPAQENLRNSNDAEHAFTPATCSPQPTTVGQHDATGMNTVVNSVYAHLNVVSPATSPSQPPCRSVLQTLSANVFLAAMPITPPWLMLLPDWLLDTIPVSDEAFDLFQQVMSHSPALLDYSTDSSWCILREILHGHDRWSAWARVNLLRGGTDSISETDDLESYSSTSNSNAFAAGGSGINQQQPLEEMLHFADEENPDPTHPDLRFELLATIWPVSSHEFGDIHDSYLLPSTGNAQVSHRPRTTVSIHALAIGRTLGQHEGSSVLLVPGTTSMRHLLGVECKCNQVWDPGI